MSFDEIVVDFGLVKINYFGIFLNFALNLLISMSIKLDLLCAKRLVCIIFVGNIKVAGF
jgi:hypothetical protein